MGYKIQYSIGSIKKYEKVSGKTRNWKTMMVVTLVILLIIGLFPLYRSGVLKELLVPGEAAITQATAEELAENLKAGIPVKEAAAIFYREIISGAEPY